MNTIWEEKLDRIFATKPKGEEELFLDIVSMFIYSKENDDISTIYKEIGIEKFSKLLGMLGGQSIELPTHEQLKDVMLASLCFYYKELKKKSWDEIKQLLPFTNMNTIRYGIYIKKLEDDILEKIKNNFNQMEEQNEDSVDEIRRFL